MSAAIHCTINTIKNRFVNKNYNYFSELITNRNTLILTQVYIILFILVAPMIKVTKVFHKCNYGENILKILYD